MTPEQQKILAEAAAEFAPVGHFQGLSDQFLQGISLGSIDEAQAALERATGSAGDYDKSLKRQTRQRADYAAANPLKAGTAVALGAITPVVMSYLGGVGATPATGGASMVLPTATTVRALPLIMDALYGVGGAGKVAASNTIRQGMREGAKAGLGPGAVEGYASANPGQRGYGAAQGAVVGSGLGGIIGGASVALPNALGFAKRKVGDLQDYLAGLGNDPTIGSINLGYNSSPRAPRPPAPPPTPATAAEAQIMQAMQEGQITQDQAISAIGRAQQLNVPLTIADVGGQPVQRLTRSVRTLSGPGSAMVDKTFEARARGGAGRVINAVELGIGAKSTGNPAAVSDNFREQARANSDPFYAQLPGLPSISNADVRAQMQTPTVQRIIQAEEKANRDVGRSVSSLYNNDGALARNPTFEEVDAVKKIVGETINANRRFGSRPTDPIPAQTQTEIERAQDVVNNLLRGADASAGGDVYASARRAYELPMQKKNAFDAGVEQFRSRGDFETLRDIQTMPEAIFPGNLNQLRRGQVEALRQQVGRPIDVTSNPNRVAPIYGSINQRAQLDAAVPNVNRRQRMQERLDLENQMFRTNNYVRGGSNTADKLAEAGSSIIGDAVFAAPGGVQAVGVATAKSIGNAIKSFFGKETRAEIAGYLTNMNSKQSIEFLKHLKDLQERGEITTKAIKASAAATATLMNE